MKHQLENSSTDLLTKGQLLRRYRLLLFAAAVAYVLWRLPYLYYLPNAVDSFLGRFSISLLCLNVAGLTFLHEKFRERVVELFTFAVSALFLHTFYLVWLNDMHPLYVLGGYTAVFATGVSFITLRSLFHYYLIVGAATGTAFVVSPEADQFLFFAGIVTSSLISYVGLRYLLRFMTELKTNQVRLNERTEELFALTGAIQTLFLPAVSELEDPRFKLQGLYQPLDKCGGDWWWYKQKSKDKMMILIGDVTGHGPGPAMITASVASYFRIIENIMHSANFGQLLIELNRNVVLNNPNGNAELTYFMSLTALEVDFKTREVSVWFAAGTPILIISKDGKIKELAEMGSHLGSEDFHLGFAKASLKPGDRIFMYTDGIVEACTFTGKQFGDRRLNRFLRDTIAEAPVSTLDSLSRQICKYRGAGSQEDDYTAILFDFIGDEAEKKSEQMCA